ncbi:MAG: TolC family protein [Candidatus Melainabacteria bacterium]
MQGRRRIPGRLAGPLLAVLMFGGGFVRAEPDAITLVGAMPSDREARPVCTICQDTVGASEAPSLLTVALSKTETLPVTLADVLQRVNEDNLLIREQDADRRAARVGVYRTLSNLLPDGQGSYAHSHFQGGVQIFGDQVLTIKQRRIVPQMSVRKTYSLGQLVDIATSRYESVAAKHRLESTRQEALAGAAKAYYRWQESQNQVENLNDSVTQAQAQVDFNQARQAAGVGIKLDVMQAQAFLSEQQQRLLEAEGERVNAEQELLNRMNLPPGVSLQAEEANVGDAVTPAGLVPEGLVSDTLIAQAMANRPEIRQAESALKAKQAAFWSRLTDIVPSVNLEGYINYTGPDSQQLVYSRFYGLRVEANLLENAGLAIPLDLRRQSLEIQADRAALENLKRGVEQSVIQAQVAMVTRQQALGFAETRLEAAEEALRLADGRYKAGLSSFLDVLKAQADLSEARINRTHTQVAYRQAGVDLVAALGAVSEATLLNGLTLNP